MLNTRTDCPAYTVASLARSYSHLHVIGLHVVTVSRAYLDLYGIQWIKICIAARACFSVHSGIQLECARLRRAAPSIVNDVIFQRRGQPSTLAIWRTALCSAHTVFFYCSHTHAPNNQVSALWRIVGKLPICLSFP